MNDSLFSIREVACILHVQPYQIAYLLTTGKVPEPKFRLGNRRAFSAEDIQRLSTQFNVAMPKDLMAAKEAGNE